MSIYQKVLGDQFKKLHPKLQQRYNFQPGRVFKASGIMQEIKGGAKWLYPINLLGTRWKFLFPERGDDISFTIKNEERLTEDGNSEVSWERAFHFPKHTRYFNARMLLDADRLVIKDYFGDPSIFYSDLAMKVTDDGALMIHSLNQKLILGRLSIPLPRIFHGLAEVKEMYDEVEKVFHIHVHVRNPIVGTVFSYEGTFTEDADA